MKNFQVTVFTNLNSESKTVRISISVWEDWMIDEPSNGPQVVYNGNHCEKSDKLNEEEVVEFLADRFTPTREVAEAIVEQAPVSLKVDPIRGVRYDGITYEARSCCESIFDSDSDYRRAMVLHNINWLEDPRDVRIALMLEEHDEHLWEGV